MVNPVARRFVIVSEPIGLKHYANALVTLNPFECNIPCSYQTSKPIWKFPDTIWRSCIRKEKFQIAFQAGLVNLVMHRFDNVSEQFVINRYVNALAI